MRLSLARTVLPFLCAGALFVAHGLSFGAYVADDAGISLAYARNLAAGDGLVLTPGAERVEGYSNPLWVLVLAVAVAAGVDPLRPEWLFKALGLVLGVATIGLAAAFARRYYFRSPSPLRWIAPILIALSTAFTFWAVAGLENPLYALLILAAVFLYAREIEHPHAAFAPVWSALALFAAALTRPEGVALFGAFAIHRLILLIAENKDRGRRLRRAGIWCVTFAGSFGAFLLCRYWYFDAWLPNTFYAKLSDRHLSRLPEYLATLSDPGWKYLSAYAGEAGLLVVLLAAIGLLDARHWRVNLLVAGVLATMALFILYAGGDWWPAHRFVSPVVPLIALAAQQGVAVTLRAVRRRPAAAAAIALAMAAAIPGNAAATAAIWTKDDDALIGLRSRLAQGMRIRALADAAHLDRPLYLDPDIGGPSLAGGLRILDLGMLTDVHLARFHYYPPFFRQYVFEEQRPAFVRTHSVWTKLSRLTRYPEFARDYLPIAVERDEMYGVSGEFVRKDLFVSTERIDTAPLMAWNEVQLHAFTTDGDAAAASRLPFTWKWSCSPSCAADYVFHVRIDHVTPAVVTASRTSSSPVRPVVVTYRPVFGWYPTTAWREGEVITTTQDVRLPRGAAGELDISVAATAPGSEPVFERVARIRVAPATHRVAAESRTRDVSTPVDVAQLLRDAEEKFDRGDYQGAIAGYRAVLDVDPSRPRVRRRLEDARERSRWMEYLYDTDRFDLLRRRYSPSQHAGQPGERELLEDLAILRNAQPTTVLHEDGQPTLALLSHRVVPRSGDIDNRVRLYFKVMRSPKRNYQLWLHASPAGDPQRLMTWGFDTRTPTRHWQPGEERVVTFMLDVPPGEYSVRAGFWQPSGSGAICPSESVCYLALGTYRLGQ